MNCQQTEPRLQQLLDDRQDIHTDPQLQEHLELCSDCESLAMAYSTLASVPANCPPSAQVPGLADRVVAAVRPTSTVKQQTLMQMGSTPRSWSTLAVAASLLIVVGFAIGRRELPGAVDGAPGQATGNATTDMVVSDVAADPVDAVLANTAPAEVAGRDMWFRTGRGLASFSLASLRSQSISATDAETPSDQQLLDRAYNTLRSLWPREGESSTLPRGETGWLDRAAETAMA